MPYSIPIAHRVGNKLVIEIELPEHGELSLSGRAENLVNPSDWLDCYDDGERLAVKLTVCKPLRQRGRRHSI